MDATEKADRIRYLVGEGRKDEALDLLEELVESTKNGGLKSQFSALKSRRSKEKENAILGIEEDQTTNNNINEAILKLTDSAEKIALEDTRINVKKDKLFILLLPLGALGALLFWAGTLWVEPAALCEEEAKEKEIVRLVDSIQGLNDTLDLRNSTLDNLLEDTNEELVAEESLPAKIDKISKKLFAARKKIAALEPKLGDAERALRDCREAPVNCPPQNPPCFSIPSGAEVKFWCERPTWEHNERVKQMKKLLEGKNIAVSHAGFASGLKNSKTIQYKSTDKSRKFVLHLLDILNLDYRPVANPDIPISSVINIYVD